MRNLTVGLLLLALVPAACGDSSSDDDKGNEAGAGGTSGDAGADTGGSSTGGRGGSAGSSRGGRGGTSSGSGGEDGGEPTGGTSTGGSAGEDGGDGPGGGGMGGDPETGGTGGGGTAGAGGSIAGAGGAGMGGGGAAGAGVGGGGAGGAGAGGGAGTGGGGAGGSGGGVCTDSPIRCALGTCPAGTSAAFYTYSGAAVPITDNDVANPAVVTIAVTTPGLVSRIVAQTSITHTYDSDLEIWLSTPYGMRELSTDNGGNGANYTSTVFADSGTAAITAGTAPFTGIFRPEQDLASLSGTPLAGNYRLRVADDLTGDTGQVTNVSIGVCQCLASSGQCEFGLACLNGIDDDGDALVDCQEPACASSPGCPKPESACGDGIDNDADNLTDCNDPSCSWACTALGSSCTGANRLFAYQPANLPQAIPASGTTRLTAPTFAGVGGSIVTAAVRLGATHTYTGDLTLFVTSPAGTILDLTSGNGGTGENYTSTVFIDSAATLITAGAAPFTGSFRPEQPLSGWTGQSAYGVWTADLQDNATGDGGNFTDLALALCVTP